MQINQRVQYLNNISTSQGLIMKTGQATFSPIRLALNPYLINRNLYTEMGDISKVWQKLIYNASKDHDLITKTFAQVAKIDQMINKLFQIYIKSSQLQRKDLLMFSRIDFFKNTNDEFKIIEYNLTSVSMASHSQNFQKAKILSQMTENNNKIQFPINMPSTDISDSIKQMYNTKNLKGIFLMIVSSKQKNIIDQAYIQVKLLQREIKVKRQCLCSLYYKIHQKQNKIFIDNEQISMIYYRTGYQPSDYCQNGKFQQCWAVRQMIQLSDAIKIPDIKMELMNQKRMQVQLSKKEVHQKYLTEDQCKILQKSLVFTIDFQSNPQNVDYVKFIEEKGVNNFILKPNLEGGGNNLYGINAYNLLKNISEEERKKYILMQKIETTPIQNTVFTGNSFATQKCICEVSRYGIVSEIDSKLIKNSSDGYLVRIKPQNADEGGVMAGVGAISSMAYQK